MEKVYTKIDIGLKEKVSFIHVSDTHLTLADGRDGERKVNLAKKRARIFPGQIEDLIEIEKTSKELNLPIMHTGDLIDFVSRKNLEYAKKYVQNNDIYLSAGNHEFSLYVGEAFEDEAYRNKSLNRVQSCFKNDIRFYSKKLGKLNCIFIDDSYYRFDLDQFEKLKKEVSYNMPIILFMHCCLYDSNLRKIMSNAEAPYVVCPPEKELENCSEYRIRQQTPDDITKEMTEYIKNEKSIKAIITGHLHFDWEGTLDCGIPQYVTGIKTMRIFEIT